MKYQIVSQQPGRHSQLDDFGPKRQCIPVYLGPTLSSELQKPALKLINDSAILETKHSPYD